MFMLIAVCIAALFINAISHAEIKMYRRRSDTAMSHSRTIVRNDSQSAAGSRSAVDVEAFP